METCIIIFSQITVHTERNDLKYVALNKEWTTIFV
jgi:hypothetical protein